MVWSQVCDPTCSSWVLGSSGVSVAPLCRLSLWPHPLLLFSRRGFLPWAFVRTWVGRLRSCLGSYLLLGELSFPCPGFSLGGSCHLIVQTPGIFLESLLGFFPLASSVCCRLEVVQVNAWLSTLRSLAVDVVTLVLCQVLVGLPGDLGVLPCYTCGCAHTDCWALGFLGFLPVLRPPSGSSSPCSSGSSSPLGLPTFTMGSPLRGRGSFVLDRNEGLVSPFGSGVMVSFLVRPRTSV